MAGFKRRTRATKRYAKRKMRTTRLSRPTRPMKSKKWDGQLAITRVMNVCGANGFSIDGNLSTSSGNSHLICTTSGTVNAFTFGAFSFYVKMADLPNYTEFANLYDQYKIVGVKFKMLPFSVSPATGAAATATGSQPTCVIHSVIDYDDESKPAASEVGIDSLRQYRTYKSINPFLYQRNGLQRYFTPRIATAAYNGAFTGYKNEKFGWVDCDYTAVRGYGLKGIFENISGGAINLLWFKVEAKVYLVLKNPR